jgi:threonine/homoserine/homoserine lactone efflux protein
VRVLGALAAALIAGYAIGAWRARPVHRPPTDASRLPAGIATGALLTLPNPGALAAWVAVAAALLPGAAPDEAAALAAGVGAGSAGWFALLAHLAARVPPGHRALRIIPRAALVALLGIATYALTTAARAGCS